MTPDGQGRRSETVVVVMSSDDLVRVKQHVIKV